MDKLTARKNLTLNLFYLLYFVILVMTLLGTLPFWGSSNLPLIIYAAIMLIIIGIMHKKASEKMEDKEDEKRESVDSLE